MEKHTFNRYALILLFLLIPTLLWSAPPSRIYTYTTGETIDPSKVTSNEDAIFNYLIRGVDTFSGGITTDNITDGTLTNADISGSAAIADSKLAQITTASKVSGTALTGLASIPSGAGIIPSGNIPADTTHALKGANSDITSLSGLTTALSTAQGGTGATAAANAANGVVVLDANGKLSGKSFGALVDKSGDYGAQQATTDGFVTAYTTDVEGGGYINGLTDAASDPTTVVARNRYRSYSAPGNAFIMFPVKKNDYWKVVTDLAISKVYWIPSGS